MYKNHEHYNDPTAGKALAKIQREEREFNDIVSYLNRAAKKRGFEITSITLKPIDCDTYTISHHTEEFSSRLK